MPGLKGEQEGFFRYIPVQRRDQNNASSHKNSILRTPSLATCPYHTEARETRCTNYASCILLERAHDYDGSGNFHAPALQYDNHSQVLFPTNEASFVGIRPPGCHRQWDLLRE